MKIRMKTVIWAFLLITCLVTGCMRVSAQAAQGSLTVCAGFENRPMEQAEFQLYKVGCWKEGAWTYEEEYRHLGLTLDFSDSSLQGESAKHLYAYLTQKGIKGLKNRTNTQGFAVYGELEQGIYLVAQTEKITDEKFEYISAPALVMLPTQINGEWKYQLILEMKFQRTELGREDPIPSETPMPEPSRSPEPSEMPTPSPGVTEIPKPTEQPDVSAAPVRPGITGASQDSSGNRENSSFGGGTGVQTGDETTPILYLFLLFLSTMLLIVRYKFHQKRK